MALTSCPDCKHEMSNLALAYTYYERPIAQIKNIAATKKFLTTTQLTRKKYKIHAVISSVLAFFGVPVFLN